MNGHHEQWKQIEAASAARHAADDWLDAMTVPLLTAPAILDLVAEEIAGANPAAKHAHARHDVLTMIAIASGAPGGLEHNRARIALERFVRECGEDGIRAWADHNDAPTMVVGLRACAELMRAKV